MAKKFSSEEERKAYFREKMAKSRGVKPSVKPENVKPKDVKPLEVKHVKLTPELLKELSVQSWCEEGPIMLEGIPTSKNIQDIKELIKAKYGGRIHYEGETPDQRIYRRWRELSI